MEYINTVNGAVINTTSKLGGVWVEKTHTKPIIKETEEVVPEEAPKKTRRTKK